MSALFSHTPSKNLQKYKGHQVSIQLLLLIVGLLFCVAAATTEQNVMSPAIYGEFVTSVKAEYWSWPIFLSSVLYMFGIYINGNWRWSSALRVFGSLFHVITLTLFTVNVPQQPDLNPFAIGTGLLAGYNVFFTFLNLGDLYRAIKRGDPWKKKH